jgi:hypothetical protein
MAADQRSEALRRGAGELLVLEREVAQALERPSEAFRAHAEVAAAVERFRAMAAGQRDALAAYLGGTVGEQPVATPIRALFSRDGADSPGIAGLLRAAYAAFNYAAMGYAILTELAFRLYEPPLRELARKHLRAYAEAAQQINQLIAGVVAADLRQEGLDCHCICPMCSIGACGCVAIATRQISAAWRETAPEPAESPDFILQPPRPDSELARAGVQGGERLLAVDDRSIQAFTDVQAAIREHQIGEAVRFRFQRGAEPPREVLVRHVGDYPSTPPTR